MDLLFHFNFEMEFDFFYFSTHLCLFRNTGAWFRIRTRACLEGSLVMAVASTLKSGNKSEKNLATEFENDSNHNKNNRLKHWKCNLPVCVAAAADLEAREIWIFNGRKKLKKKIGLLELYVLFEI